MPEIIIDEAAVRNVIAILQRGTYKKLTYEYIQTLPAMLIEPLKIANKDIRTMRTQKDPSVSFYSVRNDVPPAEDSEKPSPENSWKFQISIRDYVTTENPSGKANLSRAWNRVKEILLSHDVMSFKVVNSEAKTDDQRKDYEKGKQITIYIATSMNLNWNEILRNIVIALCLSPLIFHGDKPSNCQRIDDFISYRNDFNPQSPFNPISDTQSLPYKQPYNPFEYHDPFADIAFKITPEASHLLKIDHQIDALLQYAETEATGSLAAASSSIASPQR